MQLSLGASDNMVGGSDTGAGNVIAFNYAGVIVASGTGNSILGNSIHSNAQLGIDLAGGGVTANDPGDSDGIQNFPQLSSAIAGTPGTIKGTLDSGAGAYRIETPAIRAR